RFSPDGHALLIASHDGRVQRLRIPATNGPRESAPGPAGDSGAGGRVDDLELGCGPGARVAAPRAGGADVALTAEGSVCLAALQSERPPRWVQVDPGFVALSSDGGIAAFAGVDGKVRAFGHPQGTPAPVSECSERAREPSSAAATLTPLLTI